MTRGVTPHNYNVRRKPAPELLTPSHFTPSGSTKSKTAATAPQFLIDRSLLPPTSILLHGTSSTYTSPVTIYPPTPILLQGSSSTYASPVTIYNPLPTLPRILASSTQTTPSPISSPVLQPLPHEVLIDLTPSTPTQHLSATVPVIRHYFRSSTVPVIQHHFRSSTIRHYFRLLHLASSTPTHLLHQIFLKAIRVVTLLLNYHVLHASSRDDTLVTPPNVLDVANTVPDVQFVMH
ncbi:hypothetical protein CHS0354_034334 [Potamilus streckersoni]|uniref:Uncharacterized protein n=1 Tax=Potamilus streckersoni TaxID=2493646 RepID=A0AAE0W5A0_9BIVA|nr:hypothetical protein CHS0354_034334 [Potamilus streckersoni]